MAACAVFVWATASATVAQADPSPTGRTPKLLWTPERQAVWNQMRADNHPIWAQLKSNADRTGSSNPHYGDEGQWATIAFQVTGDPVYVQKAWAQLEPRLRTDTPLARHFATAKMTHYLDGATEIQNVVISRTLLKDYGIEV